MKHILPILTLALLGAATTVSASNFYYDYYLPSNVTLDPAPGLDANIHNVTYNDTTYTNQNDTVTYKTISDSESTPKNPNVISDENTFTIHRESNWATNLRGSDPNNFFRIEIGQNNKELVSLYLTDFVAGLYPDGPYNSTSNALFNDGYTTVTDPDDPTQTKSVLSQRAIVEYGYRELSKDAKGNYTVAGDTKKYNTVEQASDGKITIEGLEGKYKLADNVSIIDQVTTGNTVNRYQYYLGTFEPGDVIEVYMKDSTTDGVVYSYSSLIEDENGESAYTPFDPSAPVLDDGGEYLTATQGGFSDGGYAVGSTETDKMLYAYYFNEALSKPNDDYHDYTAFDKTGITAAAKKAMPLSQLIPTNGFAVAFGIYGRATGEAVHGGPLPGGVQIALIAGLFGLGFCYIRRRKVIVG